MDWVSLDLEGLGLVDTATLISGKRKSLNSHLVAGNTLRQVDLGNPTIVTHPRAGRHWLMLALECYFRESIAYDDSPWSDNSIPSKVLFVHEDQCNKGCAPFDNYLCVYRKDAVGCAFSQMWKAQVTIYVPDNVDKVEKLRWERGSDMHLLTTLDETVKWFRKYHPALNDRNVIDVVTFEDMLENMPSVLHKVCNFLGEEYREEDAQRVVRECTKQAVADCCEPFEINSTPRYKELQQEFREEYSAGILRFLLMREPRLKGIVDAL